ncbi:UNVERIFIED_CONTAM: 8-hydroxygeraniol oxidoreductase [Sesamum angustifolium]|uniref:8-hydroxygeraniol oxidoreductase n=1 Tax=Sesamum angustifolium TaxID=2727405 RepID=A0AAW2MH12_9LAMI
MATPPVITCKAAVIRKLGEPLQVEEIQVDPPKPSEVRIKMLCASMCHTDILCCNGFPAGLGTIVFIGAGLEKSGELNYIPLLCGRTVRGSIYGGVRTQSDLPKIVEKCVNKEIDLDELITHEVSLAEINKGFEYMKQPSCVKVVIKF